MRQPVFVCLQKRRTRETLGNNTQVNQMVSNNQYNTSQLQNMQVYTAVLNLRTRPLSTGTRMPPEDIEHIVQRHASGMYICCTVAASQVHLLS